MTPSEAMKVHSNQLEERASQELAKAVSTLTELTKPGQEINQPYLSELQAMLAEDDLIGDMDRYLENLERFKEKKWDFWVHAVRRVQEMDTLDKDDIDDLTGRIIDQWYLWVAWEEALIRARDHIQLAKKFRDAAKAARELAGFFAAKGQ